MIGHGMRRGLGWPLAAAVAATMVLAVAGDARAATSRAESKATAAAGTTRADVRQAMRRLRALGVPSVRTLVVRPGARERYAQGPRRLGRPGRARIGDVMRVGSVTKMMTATLIMQLAQEGRLQLDEPVERVLPGVVPGGRHITIAQLLGMRSGLYSYNRSPVFAEQAGRDRDRVWTPPELLAFAFAEPPDFPPGERFEYSNTNTIILGLVIEALTGRSYHEAVQERIAAPLGLRRTAIGMDATLPRPHVDGYVFEGGRRVNATSWTPTWGWAAGGAYSTPPEIGRFVRALMAGRLLEPGAVATMVDRASEFAHPGFPPMRYGLAVNWVKTRCGWMYGHGGEISGYRTWALADRRGRRSVVISAAVGSTPQEDLAPVVERRLTPLLHAAACRAFGR